MVHDLHKPQPKNAPAAKSDHSGHSPPLISHTHRTFSTFPAGTSKISRELLFSQVPSTFSRRFRASDNHPFRNHLSNQPSKWLLNPRPASPLASRRVTYVSPRGGSLRCLPENKKREIRAIADDGHCIYLLLFSTLQTRRSRTIEKYRREEL